MGVNTKMAFEEYRKKVFEKLKEYGNFSNPDEEAQEYLDSKEVEEAIKNDYKKDESVAACAWGIDLMY